MPDDTAVKPPGPVRRAEVVAAMSALMLLFCMFGLKWFGIDGVPGRAGTHTKLSTSENAWHSLTLLRWLMLLTIAVAIGSLVLHVNQSTHGARTSTGLIATVLSALTAALLTLRVLIEMPAPDRVVDQKLGAVLGLLFAIGLALSAYEGWRGERSIEHPSTHSADRGVRASVRRRAPTGA